MKKFSKNLSVSALMLMSMLSVSCVSDDEPTLLSSTEAGQEYVTEAEVSFTYTVPEEIFKYAEITVCHNNNAGTDALSFPMLDNKVTVTYNISKFPAEAPVVLLYKTTNRPAYGIDVDWDITMEIEVSMNVGGKKIVETNNIACPISGNLGYAIETMIKNVKDRTYDVKLDRLGNVEYIHGR